MGKRWLGFVLVILVLGKLATSQNVPSGGLQALAALQQAVTAMGGSAPGDSTASGTITTTAGSLTENGTIVVLTRRSDQTSEQIVTSDGGTVVYSQGSASQIQGTTESSLPLELAVTAQCPDFPLPLLVGVLNNPDSAYTYVGLETLDGVSAHHVQFWNSFASTPKLGSLVSFSQRDIWIDATSGLPLRISYRDHPGQGAVAATSVDVTFSNYTSFGGVQYPTTLEKSMNGTPWATITITNVAFNTGLTDANFPVD
jgi:outer membrane lipoprotein-sorting protein